MTTSEAPNLPELRRLLLGQIFNAIGVPLPSWLRILLTPLFLPVVHKFSQVISQLDQRLISDDLPSAARWFLPHFVEDTVSSGRFYLPPTGPLLVAGNHPGAYDILALVSNLPRQDIKIIVSDELFYRTLPHLDPYLIYVTRDPHNRMAAVRQMLQHLKAGGAMVIFPSGKVDPDPAVLPGALQALDLWSGSLEVLLRRAPETCLVIAITSGVLSPRIMKNPLSRLPSQPWQQRKLAEFIQVMLQFTFKVKFNLLPCISFSPASGLPGSGAASGDLPREIHTCAVQALTDHMELFYHAVPI